MGERTVVCGSGLPAESCIASIAAKRCQCLLDLDGTPPSQDTRVLCPPCWEAETVNAAAVAENCGNRPKGDVVDLADRHIAASLCWFLWGDLESERTGCRSQS